MKLLILISLFCLSFLNASYSQDENHFDSLIVRNGFGARPRNEFLIDFDCAFAWMGGDTRNSRTNVVPGFFVYSKSRSLWLQVVKVSTTGAKFGKTSSTTLVQAPWDFTDLTSKDFAALPLPSLVPHYPDKVTYDEDRDVFVLHFDSRFTAESERTTLSIPKKDLIKAFDYYSKRLDGKKELR